MPRPIAARHSFKVCAVGKLHRARFLVKPIGVNPILPQVCRQNKLSLRIGRNHVRMRRIMAAHRKTSRRRILRSRSAHMPAVSMHIRSGSQASVRLNGKHRRRPAPIICNECVLPRSIDAQVARPRALRTDDIQRRQIAALTLNRKRAHRSAAAVKIAHFIHRVQIPLRRMNRNPRWVGRLRGQRALRQCARSRIHLEPINPLAIAAASRLPGIRSHVGQNLLRLDRHLRHRQHGMRESS